MRFANDTELMGAVPVHRGSDAVDHWVVLVQRGEDEHERWVTAVMTSLDDSHWSWGNYFHEQAAAEADLYVRCGILDLPAQLIRDTAAGKR